VTGAVADQATGVAADRRVAVVTGAGRGIGRAISLELARNGFNVVLNYQSSSEGVSKTAAEIAGLGGAGVTIKGNVADPATAASLVAAAESSFGPLDVWVNNAGVSTLAPVLETTAESMTHMTEVNFLGTFYGVQAAGRSMVDAGRGGAIINVASDLGLRAAPLLAGYSATKFAVVGLTQAAAVELAPAGISVNAVCPGTVETEMVQTEIECEAGIRGVSGDEVRTALLDAVPAGRLCTAEDVSALVAWLTTSGAAFVTGQAICTNGGSILH
jgi:meso-butanediol dehydrogenase/(S,S)-butanediol dehydrogenase/diacetyl reductase